MNSHRFTLVSALSLDRVIGVNNGLPWKLSSDLKLFKRLTTGKTILMGRKTFESIGRPLPNRRNIVLSRARSRISGVEVFNELHQILTIEPPDQEIMVIGGGEIYKLFLPYAHRLALTVVHAHLDGDAWFPRLSTTGWGVVNLEKYQADEHNEFDFTFFDIQRNTGDASMIPSCLLA